MSIANPAGHRRLIMQTELLIRRQVTADRGSVLVSTNDVLDVLKHYGDEPFTTRDIALILAQSRQEISFEQVEYSVRRAVAWLLKRGYVSQAADNPPRSQRRPPNWGTRYVRIEVMGPCDCGLLNKIFMRA